MKKLIIALALFKAFSSLAVETPTTMVLLQDINVEKFFLIKQIIKQTNLKKTPVAEKIKQFYCLPQNNWGNLIDKVIREKITNKSIIEDDVHTSFLAPTFYTEHITQKEEYKIDWDFYIGLDRPMLKALPISILNFTDKDVD